VQGVKAGTIAAIVAMAMVRAAAATNEIGVACHYSEEQRAEKVRPAECRDEAGYDANTDS
jgi:hypothetical protein